MNDAPPPPRWEPEPIGDAPATPAVAQQVSKRPWRRQLLPAVLVVSTLAAGLAIGLVVGRSSGGESEAGVPVAAVAAAPTSTTSPPVTQTTSAERAETTVVTEPTDSPPPSPTLESTDAADVVARHLLLLEELRVVEWSDEDYVRASYLDGWPDSDGDCLSDRHELLIEESLADVSFIETGCRVETGLWQDPYSLEMFDRADLVSVDHVVALANAHRTGGFAWSDERRQAFAIDRAEPSALVISDTSVNNSKADSDPSQWLPPEPAAVCRFGLDWVRVKWRWDLGVTAEELSALRAIFATSCGSGSVLPVYLAEGPIAVSG